MSRAEVKRSFEVLVGFLLILGISLIITRHERVWYWIEVHTGTVNEPGPYYGFWSGFGSDIGEYAILVGLMHGIWLAYHLHNCKEPGCWRLGHFPWTDKDGTHYKACHIHNPFMGGKKPVKGHMHFKAHDHWPGGDQCQNPHLHR